MKVPKYIKEAIERCSYFNQIANKYQIQIYKWLENKKLTEETAEEVIRNMEDAFIDNCLMTYNPENFIKRLEELV